MTPSIESEQQPEELTPEPVVEVPLLPCGHPVRLETRDAEHGDGVVFCTQCRFWRRIE